MEFKSIIIVRILCISLEPSHINEMIMAFLESYKKIALFSNLRNDVKVWWSLPNRYKIENRNWDFLTEGQKTADDHQRVFNTEKKILQKETGFGWLLNKSVYQFSENKHLHRHIQITVTVDSLIFMGTSFCGWRKTYLFLDI